MNTQSTLGEDIQLDPNIDQGALRRAFERSGRIHIPNVLARGADRIHQCLVQETEYNLVVNSGDKYFDLSPADIAKMDSEQRVALSQAVHAGVLKGFQLFYDNHRMTDEGEPYPNPTHFLANVVAFLNSPDFLAFVRAVTGEKIVFADAQATRYRSGHFLSQHDDGIAGKNRLVAFVLNMTPQWHADWGGNLLFLNKAGNIAEGYVPAFNALNLFKVPQPHLVSHVALFAPAARYSITGWLRTR